MTDYVYRYMYNESMVGYDGLCVIGKYKESIVGYDGLCVIGTRTKCLK